MLLMLATRTAVPAAATTPMYRLPFMSFLRGSGVLEIIGHPPDEAGVVDAPDETGVEAAIPAEAPDEAGGSDVEEVARDQPVLPDETGRRDAVRPDETARLRRAGGPGDIAPLVILAEHDVAVGKKTVVVGDTLAPRVETAAPDQRLGVGGLRRGEDGVTAQ